MVNWVDWRSIAGATCYLLIARLPQKLDSFVRLPAKRRVRAIGEVIGPLPMPDDPAGGPMHRLPRLAWKTWIRLALIPAGGDWRDLQRIDHRAYRLEYTPRGAGAMGVQTWNEPSSAVTGAAGWGRSNAPTAVADARSVNDEKTRHTTHYRVTRWTDPSGTVTGATHVANGLISVADLRVKAQGHPGGHGGAGLGKGCADSSRRGQDHKHIGVDRGSTPWLCAAFRLLI
ncbi:MAG: hypothetical protein ACYCYO_16830 [Bacilli bacterium]